MLVSVSSKNILKGHPKVTFQGLTLMTVQTTRGDRGGSKCEGRESGALSVSIKNNLTALRACDFGGFARTQLTGSRRAVFRWRTPPKQVVSLSFAFHTTKKGRTTSISVFDLEPLRQVVWSLDGYRYRSLDQLSFSQP